MIEQVKLLRKVVVLWLSLLTFLTMGGFMWEDYRSCQRQEPVREVSAIRAEQLKAAWYADAERAENYAKIDPDPKGRAVNARFATERRVLADSLSAAPPIECSSFPPGR